MEKFRIQSPFDKQDFIRAMKIRWEIHWLKSRKQLKTYSILAFTILSLGIIVMIDDGKINPLVFMGICFTLVTLLLVLFMLYSKRQYFQKSEKLAEKYASIKLDCTYEFSNESIKYWDSEKTIEFKWTVFTHYSTYKNYLILFLNNSIITSYLFEKTEAEIEDYNKIFDLAQSKLEYKEIQ